MNCQWEDVISSLRGMTKSDCFRVSCTWETVEIDQWRSPGANSHGGQAECGDAGGVQLTSLFSSCNGFMNMLTRLSRAHKVRSSSPWSSAWSTRSGVARWQAHRPFSSSPKVEIAVAEMSQKDLASLRIKQERLMNDIHSTCEWGKGERWGEYVGFQVIPFSDISLCAPGPSNLSWGIIQSKTSLSFGENVYSVIRI